MTVNKGVFVHLLQIIFFYNMYFSMPKPYTSNIASSLFSQLLINSIQFVNILVLFSGFLI